MALIDCARCADCDVKLVYAPGYEGRPVWCERCVAALRARVAELEKESDAFGRRDALWMAEQGQRIVTLEAALRAAETELHAQAVAWAEAGERKFSRNAYDARDAARRALNDAGGKDE